MVFYFRISEGEIDWSQRLSDLNHDQELRLVHVNADHRYNYGQRTVMNGYGL